MITIEFKKLTLIQIIFIGVILSTPFSFAQSSSSTNGLNYLQSTQSPEGYWGDVSEVPYNSFIDTCAVAETLKYLTETGTAYTSAIQWINSVEVFNNDYLFTKMLVLAQAGFDVSTIRDYLLSIRNDDGGWGVIEGFTSDIKRTVLALQAMRTVNYPDQNVISSAINYLISIQNTDGGFGFYQGDGSNVYMTALVSMTLQQFPQTTSIATAINKATSYLIAHQNQDGWFGSSASTIYETAYAYMALVGVTTDNTVLGNAINYLTGTQLPNGSWNDDPYSTALALRTLYLSENKPTPPPQPDKGTVTGIVVDATTNQPLGGVSVVSGQLSTTTTTTGEFTLSNIPQGSQTITFSLAGYAIATATVNITAGSIINLGTIPLSPSPTTGIIKGMVTDAGNGQPLEGVTISVTGSFTGSTVTGTDGTFIFTNVNPGSVTLTASKTGYYSVTGTGTVVAGGILFFNPQLSTQPPTQTTGNLTGRVLDALTNQPIQGAIISISGGPSGNTDTQGIFLIKDITPGTYQVTISASGYISQLYQVMIIAGVITDMQTVYLTPSPQSTTIKGKVTDAQTGNPIAGVEVVVVGTNLSSKTDSQGAYTISGINLLEFSLKASAIGYDSLTYNVKTSIYGTYTVDFVLNPSAISKVKIVSLTTDKSDYPASDPLVIMATVENTGDTSIDVLVNAQIKDQSGNLLAFISQQAEPALTLNPHSMETVQLLWETGQNPPGVYFIILSVVDTTSGILQAEGETFFTIIPTILIDEVKPLSSPKFINVKATETIHLSVSMINRSNIDISLLAKYEIKDPNGVILRDGSVEFSMTPAESLKVVELVDFTHTFTESGSYPVRIDILSEGNIISTVSDAIHVAPSIRIEPSKFLTPTTVIPDGDKKIEIRIQIRGIEDKP